MLIIKKDLGDILIISPFFIKKLGNLIKLKLTKKCP